MGSTGDPPVPVGDSPTGRSRRPLPKGPSLFGSGAILIRPGESLGGPGQGPVPPKYGFPDALSVIGGIKRGEPVQVKAGRNLAQLR